MEKKRKFIIPFKPGTPEYQRALYLCHKMGVTDYKSAVSKKRGENADNLNVRKPSNNIEGLPHWKEIIRKTVYPDHTPRIDKHCAEKSK